MNWFNALKTFVIVALICLLNARNFISAEIIADEGKSDNLSLEPSNNDMVFAEAASKRAWQQLHNGWGKRAPTIDDEQPLQPPLIASVDIPNNLDYVYGPGPRISQNFNDKRIQKMNNSWRKRDWTQLRNNGWGKKREPNNWNNLRGLWGKRSSPQLTWNKPEWGEN